MTSVPEAQTSPLTPRTFLVRLGAGALLLTLFVIFMSLMSLRQSWRNHQDRAAATTQNLAQVLDRFVADTFSKADLAVWAVKDEVERATLPGGRREDLDAFLRRQHQRIPGLLALRTTDAHGVINHESGVGSGSRSDLADRSYFQRLQEDPQAGLVISEPLVSRVTGDWVIIAARRLNGPDQGFGGIAYAVIALDQFERAFSALDLGKQGSVALRDLELGLITRHPKPIHSGTAIGQKVVSDELLAFARSGQLSGTYRTRTPFDQVRRTFGFRKVSGQPFYLLVGLSEEEFLAPWRREVLGECLEVLFFTGLILVGTWLIRRHWLEQQAAHGNLEQLLSEVRTLGGMLPICSHCKKIRDDKGYWNKLEAYLNEHTDAEFTHGICPDCAKEVFPRSSGRNPTI